MTADSAQCTFQTVSVHTFYDYCSFLSRLDPVDSSGLVICAQQPMLAPSSFYTSLLVIHDKPDLVACKR